MSLADEIAKEMEIKVDLILEGVNIEEAALEGVGTQYIENINYVFDYMRHGLEPGKLWPSEMFFPAGTLYKVIYDTRSPYLVTQEDGTLVLRKNGKFVSEVRWAERPKFFGEKTSFGTEMRKIAVFRGDCGIVACVSDFCTNWSDGSECRYCNFGLAKRNQDTSAVIQETLYTAQRAQEVGEFVKAAIEEGIRPCFITSSGDLPGEGVTASTIRIINAVKRATGRDTMIGCVNLAVPDDFAEIDKLYEAGARNIIMDQEVWHPDMFKAICPGKAKRIGRERWMAGLLHAVKVFGPGNVFNGFVCGLEEKENYFEAARWCSSNSIVPLFQPWYPQKGSHLEDHRPPRLNWMMEVHQKCMDIATANLPVMLTREFNNSDKLGCYRCIGVVICWDDLRLRLGDFTKVQPRDKIKQELAA